MTTDARIEPVESSDVSVLSRSVMTVEGPVLGDQLGPTLVAETVLGNGLQGKESPVPLFPYLWDRPVTLDALGRLRRDIWSNKENWDLTGVDLAVSELRSFREAGGGTVINATFGIPAAPSALVEVAERSGVHIVAGLVPERRTASADERKALVSRLTSESRDGMGGTPVRPGILGPIEVTEPARTGQAELVRSVLEASESTGLPLLIRCPPDRLESLLELLAQAKATPNRVILDVDVVPEPTSIKFQSAEGGAYGAIVYGRVLPEGVMRAAEAGYYLAFASLGFEVYYDRNHTESARDPQRIAGIAQLIKQGHLHQLLVSQGIRLRTQLRAYGGWGYAHILRNVVPMMERAGLAPKEITTVLKWNPMRALCVE